MLKLVDIAAYHFCFYAKFMPNKWFLIVSLVVIIRNTHFFWKGCGSSDLCTRYSCRLWKSQPLSYSYPNKAGRKGKKSPSDLPEVWWVICSPPMDVGPAKAAHLWVGPGFYGRILHFTIQSVILWPAASTSPGLLGIQSFRIADIILDLY